ncbi:hypothetical protein CPT_Muenster_228 [Klebsiella phage Muenster]|nr:hypothetical protein CPT_Muenster_228 [Klebsiella phage Muenster]
MGKIIIKTIVKNVYPSGVCRIGSTSDVNSVKCNIKVYKNTNNILLVEHYVCCPFTL